jgi:hypothetical protein
MEVGQGQNCGCSANGKRISLSQIRHSDLLSVWSTSRNKFRSRDSIYAPPCRSQLSSRQHSKHHTYWLTLLLACTKKSIFRQHDALIRFYTALHTSCASRYIYTCVHVFNSFFFLEPCTWKSDGLVARTKRPCS